MSWSVKTWYTSNPFQESGQVVNLQVKFVPQSEDIHVGTPIYDITSNKQSQTLLAFKFFNTYANGNLECTSIIFNIYLWPNDDGGSIGPIISIIS